MSILAGEFYQVYGCLYSFSCFKAVGESELSFSVFNKAALWVHAKPSGDINDPGVFIVCWSVDFFTASGSCKETEKIRTFMGLDVIKSQVKIEARPATFAILNKFSQLLLDRKSVV